MTEKETKEVIFSEEQKELLITILHQYFSAPLGGENLATFGFLSFVKHEAKNVEQIKKNYQRLLKDLRHLREVEHHEFPQPYEIEDLPTFEELASEVKERLEIGHREFTANKILEKIKDGVPFKFELRSVMAHGDRFIVFSALKIALTQLSKMNGIQYPKISFSHTGFDLSTLFNSTEKSLHDKGENSTASSNSQYIHWRWYSDFCDYLGIELLQSLERAVPVPMAIDDEKKVFANYSRETVESTKQGIELQKDKKLVVITQTGSHPIKRLNDEQISSLVSLFDLNKYQVVIVKDDEIGKPAVELQYEDGVVHARDLNDVSAFAELADVIISTDSLWNWWMAGSQYYRTDGKKAQQFGFYTIADERHHIPSITNIKAQTLKENPPKPIGLQDSGMFTENFYLSKNNISLADVPHISDRDFKVLYDELERRFGSF